jgi:hypothetical protein
MEEEKQVMTLSRATRGLAGRGQKLVKDKVVK